MPDIVRPAIKIEQTPRFALYSTVFTLEDLVRPKFYDVNKLDVKKDKGYQRLLDDSRAKKLAKDIKEAWQNKEAFLPTSVLLASDKELEFRDGHIRFDPVRVCPFNVVDGQHRLEGLRWAIKDDKSLGAFPLAVNIAVGMAKEYQTLHFLIVNTKQKSVDKGVEQRILARFTKQKGVSEIPWLPSWLQREVDKNNYDEAVAIVDHLNSAPDSPWRGRIKPVDQTGRRNIPDRSFVTNLRQMILNPGHPLKVHCKPKQRLQILTNYWRAIANLLVSEREEEDSVVLKNNGLWFFHYVSQVVFSELAAEKDFTVGKIEACFRGAFDEMEDSQIRFPAFWKHSGDASRLNRSALLNLAKDFNDAAARFRQEETGEMKL